MAKSDRIIPVAAAIGLVVGASGLAAYAATNSKNTYYACLTGGELTKVGKSKPKTCRQGKVISWNEAGPRGAAGPIGPQGAPGAPGAAGPPGPGVEAVDLACDTLAADNPDKASINLFLKVTGVVGDSVNAKHKGEVDITSFCMGGATSADAGVFTVEKAPDVSSVKLLQLLADGTAVDSAVVTEADPATGATIAQYRFSGVTVNGYRFGGHESTDEDLSFGWDSAVLQTFSQGPTGTWIGSAEQALAAPSTSRQTVPRCAALTTEDAPGAATGVDMFLSITGVTGGSVDAKHKGEMDVQSVCFGGSRPGAAAPTYTSMTVSKAVDQGSAVLHGLFSKGTVSDAAKVTIRRKSNTPVDMFTFAMTSPKITGIRTGGRGGVRHEDLALVAPTTKVSFTGQNPDGTAKPPVSVTLVR